MAQQSSGTAATPAPNKTWGFGTGSLSMELQAAAAQIIADSRMPGSQLSVLLNSFFARCVVWPYRAAAGKPFDATGTELPECTSLIYAASEHLERVPADSLACAIETHSILGLDELRSSYEKIAKIKALAKASMPETSSSGPRTDTTMGIVFAVDSNVPVETLGEELERLNRSHDYNHWVDMVVVLSRGTVAYGAQFPHRSLGDFLPPGRNGMASAAMYVHIVARAHSEFSLNRMCSVLFTHLYLFSPGTPLSPYNEILEGAPKVGMTIAPYQQNLAGKLVPVPLELRFNRFFLFPVGVRVVANTGEELGRVQYLPWQDGGVVRVTGKMPIEAVLVFGGKTALSQPVVKLAGDQFSGVLPMSQPQFVEMTERMARQSHNMLIKPDPRPNWVVETRGNEGTASPFVARLLLGICRLRDQALSEAKMREAFDAAFESVVNDLEVVRSAAAGLTKTFTEFAHRASRGEVARVVDGVTYLDKTIDKEIRKLCDEVIGTASRAIKDKMQAVLKPLGVEIGFLFQKQTTFATGLAKLKQQAPALADYIDKTRTGWSERLILCRNGFEHTICSQLKVKLQIQNGSVTAVEPQIDGQPITEFAKCITDRICCFVEDLLAHALQTRLPEGVSIAEIPLTDRNPENVERFRLALVGGGANIWAITYHPTPLDAH